MLYAALKTVHLLSLIVWIGGMFFTLACLRPALAVLEGPARVRLMDAVLVRFFAIVNAAIGLVLLSGLAMLWIAYQGLGGGANALRQIPSSWALMIVLGLTMMGIFGHVRGALSKRLRSAVQVQDAPAGAAALAEIRRWVTINLALGVVVIVAMKLAAAA